MTCLQDLWTEVLFARALYQISFSYIFQGTNPLKKRYICIYFLQRLESKVLDTFHAPLSRKDLEIHINDWH